jgi:hypothetical protein
MTVTLTYDPTLARVIISCNSLGAAVTALVERSTDQITWVTVRGGIDVTVTAGAFARPVDDYEFVPNVQNFYRVDPDTGSNQTGSLTPTLTATWLKSIARPFLNMSFAQSEIVSDAARPERDGVFDIIGRSLPIAVTDVRSSLQYNLRLVTRTLAEANALDMLLASGDTLFLHVPPTWPLPSAYVAAGSAPREFRWSTDWSTWTLAIKEVAAPGPDIIGGTSTYQTVLSTYATYTTFLAAHSDYADVLTLIGSPSEVIVP